MDDGEMGFALELPESPSTRDFFCEAQARRFSRLCCAAWKPSGLRSKGRRRVLHHTLSLHLERVLRHVRIPRLVSIFVYEHNTMFGGVEGLAEVVGNDRTESEDM